MGTGQCVAATVCLFASSCALSLYVMFISLSPYLVPLARNELVHLKPLEEEEEKLSVGLH